MRHVAYTETTPKPGRPMDSLINTSSSVLSALNFFLHPDEASSCVYGGLAFLRSCINILYNDGRLYEALASIGEW
jgi:hypothetical protein